MNVFCKCVVMAGVTLCTQVAKANAPEPEDTLRTYRMEEVVITSSAKETNHLLTLPGSVSILSPQTVYAKQIEALKDISSLVPNLYIPDYGARLTSAIYLRGVGARSSGQAVGLYVDKAPYPDKSAFDFELTDIQRIEVLRGPQGTLYGRNAMGGIVNVYTLSPFDYQGTRLSASAGSHGAFKAKASHYAKWRETLGLSLGGYYSRSDGYFTNQFTGKKADSEQLAGGRLKLDWRPLSGASAVYTLSYDYVSQGAFPYGLYHRETGLTEPVRSGDPSTYRRRTLTQSLGLDYRTARFLLSSVTACQLFSDAMQMDQDFSPRSLFTLNQQQKQQALSQEWALRSQAAGPYQWSVGLYGFVNGLHTEGPVTFGADGVKDILQKVFDDLRRDNPRMPALVALDEQLLIPGSFDTPSRGAALFHQSTYDDFLVPGLSLTAGLRLDYERQQMHYRSTAGMRVGIAGGGSVAEIPGIRPSVVDTLVWQDFRQWLPKVSLRYACGPHAYAYLSVAKGYKAGGYNVQMSADLMQSRMQYDMMKQFVPALALPPEPIEKVMAYGPEHSWNYELGLRSHLPEAGLSAELTLFYMDINDMQLTRFVESGAGRILSNAGKARSLGAEASLHACIGRLTADLNYGYTRALSLDADRAGNLLPYIPAHTLNAGVQYARLFRHARIDQFTASARLSGAGPVYWTEQNENDVRQPFYALLDIKAGIRKGAVRLDVWVRNLTNTTYTAFCFESLNQMYLQPGKPLRAGIEVALVF